MPAAFLSSYAQLVVLLCLSLSSSFSVSLMYFSLPISVLAPSLTHLPSPPPSTPYPSVSLSDLQFFPLFLISGTFYASFSHTSFPVFFFFLPQSLILYVFMLYPNPLPFFSCSPCGQYLRLKGHFSFSLWSFPVPSPSAYLPKGGIIKVSCLFWLFLSGKFQVSPVFHLGMKGVGGAVLLMTLVWGWQREGSSLGPIISLAFLSKALGNYTF